MRPNANESGPIVFVVGVDPDVRQGLETLFGAAGIDVQFFSSAQQFMESERPDRPSCLVLDIRRPGSGGAELQRALAAVGCSTPVVFMTGYGVMTLSIAAMEGDAGKLVEKRLDDRELLTAVQRAVERDREARQVQVRVNEIGRRVETLTARERDVFGLVVTGLLNRQISSELGISEHTVKIHRRRVMKKMEATSVAELVMMAQKVGLPPSESPSPADTIPAEPVPAPSRLPEAPQPTRMDGGPQTDPVTKPGAEEQVAVEEQPAREADERPVGSTQGDQRAAAHWQAVQRAARARVSHRARRSRRRSRSTSARTIRRLLTLSAVIVFVCVTAIGLGLMYFAEDAVLERMARATSSDDRRQEERWYQFWRKFHDPALTRFGLETDPVRVQAGRRFFDGRADEAHSVLDRSRRRDPRPWLFELVKARVGGHGDAKTKMQLVAAVQDKLSSREKAELSAALHAAGVARASSPPSVGDTAGSQLDRPLPSRLPSQTNN